MPYPTSPSRYLAPLALFAAVLATFLVVHSASPVDSGAPAVTSSAVKAGHPASKKPRRTYVVKAGDTLSAIASKTGVALTKIESLNPEVDATALHAGQKVKLAP